ncbi:MAG: mannitol dehydrogenase family protein [Pseudomonadota bacterium]
MTDGTFFQTTYDRSRCDIGLVHIGLGSFHRSHQAVYLDDYMHLTGDLRWGIAAVNLRTSESQDFADAAASKNGYLLKTIAPDGTLEFRAVRSHQAFIDAAQDLEAAVELFARPGVMAASVTVTESGYAFAEDYSLDLTAAPIAKDLAGTSPTTIYGFLTLALARRAETIGMPMTVLCCDNIRNNGNVLKNAFLAYLKAADKTTLANWVRQNVTFPCSMVDRITPRSTPWLAKEVRRLFPSHAASPVHAESFTQWVLQDDFAGDMPALGKVGVQIVDDVTPFEEAKIRILNGGHTALAYLGALAGHQTFDEAMHDPPLRGHFDRWQKTEVLAGLGQSFPFDTSAYLADVATRLENRGIADQLERICMDGYSKMTLYIRPTLEACLRKGIAPNAGYDCVAAWVVYARKAQTGATAIPYHEPFWDRLEPMIAIGHEPRIARDPHLWGDLPKRFDSFVPSLVAAIQRMEKQWQA